jgi:hypothetical protein
MSTTRYTKNGAGQRNGLRWTDAKALVDLGADLGAAKPADLFLLGFDRDREDPVFWSQTALRLTSAATRAHRIGLKVGYIGHNEDVQPIGAHPTNIFFQNTRTSLYRKAAPDYAGDPYLILSSGADYTDISGFVLRGAPNSGFIRFDGGASDRPLSDAAIRGVHASYAGRVIETQRGTRLSGITIEDCSVFAAARGFARFRSIENSSLRDLDLNGGGIDGGGENVCQLLAFEAGTNVACENIVMRNAVNMIGAGEGRRSAYVQGDGIVCERATSDFKFQNCHAEAMGDGGFDLKTTNFSIADCSAVRCKFGIRVWSSGNNIIRRTRIASPISTGTTRGACLWVAGQVDLIDCDLQAGPGTPIFYLGQGGEGMPRVRMFGGRICSDQAVSLVAGSGGGTVELYDVSLNGEVRTQLLRA